jgi:hypothetical protein
MLNSWISDRTLCYLSSGRPAIIQDTGPTRYFSGDKGVLRFRDLEGAIKCFEAIDSDYLDTAPRRAHLQSNTFLPRGRPQSFSTVAARKGTGKSRIDAISSRMELLEAK